MDKTFEAEYWVPEHVREYLRSLGFVLPLESMEGYVRTWHEWMSAKGDFYDYRLEGENGRQASGQTPIDGAHRLSNHLSFISTGQDAGPKPPFIPRPLTSSESGVSAVCSKARL